MLGDWDWKGANASLQRALALDPGNPAVLYFAAGLAASLGRFEETLELGRRSIALDPLNASSRGALAQTYIVLGRHKEAEVNFKKALELNPHLPVAHEWLGLVYLAQGRSQDAPAEIEQEPMEQWRLQGDSIVYNSLGGGEEVDSPFFEFICQKPHQSSFPTPPVY